MEPWKAILFLFGGIGVINGILLAIFLLWKDKEIKTRFFALMILAICIRIGKSIYFYYTDDLDRVILQIGLSACIFIGPLFYLYVDAAMQPSERVSKIHQAILGVISFGIITVGLLYSYPIYPELWNGPIIKVIYLIWIVFVGLGLWKMRPIFTKNTPFNTFDKRLLSITAGLVFITLSYQFSMWFNGFTYLWGSLIFTSCFYYLVYIEIKKLWTNQKQKKQRKATPLPQGKALFQQVEQVMNTQQLYKQSSLKLKDLATHTNLSPHLLSRVLNEVYPHGFATYVNEKRVAEAKRIMDTPSNFTLEGIGYEAGFNSKSSFFSTFKKLNGCTPAKYKNSRLSSISEE